MNFTFGGTQEGWIGERSTPRTVAEGYWSPTVHRQLLMLGASLGYLLSIAQMPVPVPISRTFLSVSASRRMLIFSPSEREVTQREYKVKDTHCIVFTGAKCKTWHKFTTIPCFISSLSCSASSFGKLYVPSRNLW